MIPLQSWLLVNFLLPFIDSYLFLLITAADGYIFTL